MHEVQSHLESLSVVMSNKKRLYEFQYYSKEVGDERITKEDVRRVVVKLLTDYSPNSVLNVRPLRTYLLEEGNVTVYNPSDDPEIASVRFTSLTEEGLESLVKEFDLPSWAVSKVLKTKYFCNNCNERSRESRFSETQTSNKGSFMVP
jgi:hypothetical protein